jgi:hypothetical protein
MWMVRAQEHHVTRQNVIPTNRLTICHSSRYESGIMAYSQQYSQVVSAAIPLPSWRG